MYWPLMLTILVVLMNIPVYYMNKKAGICVSIFTVLYFLIVLGAYFYNKPAMLNEIINFATQYATVQKHLLNEFEIPYALLDYNSKILWMNEAFTQITGKDKKYHKSITTIFPSITRELLEKEGDNNNVQVAFEEKIYRASTSRIYFDEVTEDSGVIELENNEQYLTALYLFDETELHRYIQENKALQLVSALVYIDNYEEALESIEEVKRIPFGSIGRPKGKQVLCRTRQYCKKDRKRQVFCCIQA